MGNLRNVVCIQDGRILDLCSLIDAGHRTCAVGSNGTAVVLDGKLL